MTCTRLAVLPEFWPAMRTSSIIPTPSLPRNATVSTFLFIVASIVTATSPAADPFSIAVVPDPQSYTVFRGYGLYAAQSRWIRDTKTQNNTRFAIYLGDLTGSNEDVQWQVVDTAHEILDTANIPYSVLPGNHDYYGSDSGKWKVVCLRDLTKFNLNLGPSRFSGESWYGGNLGATSNHNENNYCFFSSGDLDFMVVSLELAPRKEAVTWANNLIAQHPNHRVIIATHAYLNPGGSYNASAGSNYGLVGCRGVDLYEECASRHSNVFLVVCGHVGESKVNTKTGVCGNRIYEMVVDYQFERPLGLESNPALGNGWLRLLTFDPDNNRINASTLTVVSGDPTFFTDGIDQFYEPDYNTSPTHAHHKFTLSYNMTAPLGPYTYLNASTEFHDLAANHVSGGSQLNPDIAQAANGDWAAVWEDDSDSNSIHRIFVRGFDPDGNERFTDSVVNTVGVNTTDATNPRMAMCADGRFVVVFQSADNAIKMRTYQADGTPNGTGEQLVLSTTGGTLRNPDVAIDVAGNYVVAWEDDNDGNGFYQVRCKGFRFDYSQRFATKTVNTIAAGQQLNPAIAMASNGDYVVAWDDDQDSDGQCEIGVRGFLAGESEHFGQMCAHTTTTGQQRSPAVAMDDTGRFVVAWEDDQDLNGVFQIKARGFDATGGEHHPGNAREPAFCREPGQPGSCHGSVGQLVRGLGGQPHRRRVSNRVAGVHGFGRQGVCGRRAGEHGQCGGQRFRQPPPAGSGDQRPQKRSVRGGMGGRHGWRRRLRRPGQRSYGNGAQSRDQGTQWHRESVSIVRLLPAERHRGSDRLTQFWLHVCSVAWRRSERNGQRQPADSHHGFKQELDGGLRAGEQRYSRLGSVRRRELILRAEAGQTLPGTGPDPGGPRSHPAEWLPGIRSLWGMGYGLASIFSLLAMIRHGISSAQAGRRH